jgi:hypothetical protein
MKSVQVLQQERITVMVTKYVYYEYQGDLLNLSDNFGLGNDTLYLSIPSPSNAVIKTYQGNDYVTVTNAPSGGYGYKFYLGSGNDTLFGSNLNDHYYDEGGNDQISMGAGSDHVIAGIGDDTINGGSGNDTIAFNFIVSNGGSLPNTQGITLNLGLTGPQDLGVFGSDIIINFENVWGGDGDDTLLGTNATNGLRGGAGSDYLRGLGGDDFIVGVGVSAVGGVGLRVVTREIPRGIRSFILRITLRHFETHTAELLAEIFAGFLLLVARSAAEILRLHIIALGLVFFGFLICGFR